MKLLALLVIPAMLLPVMVGCESVSHSRETSQTWDGGTKSQDTTVRQGPNGTTVDQTTTKVPSP